MDQLYGRIVSSGTSLVSSWYITDHIGSIRDIVNGNGNAVLDHLEYDGFGCVTRETTPANGDRFKFTGRELDPLTSLQYNRGRYYSIYNNRWTTRDPLGFGAGDGNLYRYVGNDPTNVVDPSGLYGVKDDWFAWCSNSAAGAADKITCGGTAWIREGLGYNDAVDQNSMAYKIGGFAGQAISIGLMFANPAALANSVLGPSLTIGLNTINMMSKASSVLSMGVEASKGDFSGVAMAGLNMVPGVLRGAGSGCGSTLLQRGIQFYGMAGGAISGAAKAINGDVIGGLLDIAQAGASAYRFMQSCFAAGTKLLTKRGWVVIERLEVGDEVWSKPEEEPGAVGAWKRVEELFVRTAMLLRVQVGGQEILTTAEHPFFIRDKGWLPAGFLEVGQQVVGKDSEWTTVEAIEQTGKVATVYNCRVAEYHTYFVGGEEWGFSVWAHNAYITLVNGKAAGSYGKLRNRGIRDDHHIIQNAAVRNLPGYSRSRAPTVELSSPSTLIGSDHYNATRAQDLPGSGTYMCRTLNWV